MTFYFLILLVAACAVACSAQVTIEDLQKFSDANNNVANTFFPRLIQGNSKNIFFCPLSIMTGLGVMLYGARGRTQQELYSVLGYKAANFPIERIPPTYNLYFTKIEPENKLSQVNYSLLCADEVLISNQITLDPMFLKDAARLYIDAIKQVDFSNTEKVTRDINNFIQQKTYGQISNIVDSVSASSLSQLIDGVYFKGKWDTTFQPYPIPQEFYSRGNTKTVPFIQGLNSFPYYETSDYQAVFLPYVGRNVGLLVILPQQTHGLAQLENNLKPNDVRNILYQLQSQITLVKLPKFRFEFYKEMTDDVIALGARSAFDGTGDFSGMTNSSGLSVSGLYYKGAFEVDETSQGDGAAANSQPLATVTVNHPFLFAVVDRRLNLLLFYGRVINV